MRGPTPVALASLSRTAFGTDCFFREGEQWRYAAYMSLTAPTRSHPYEQGVEGAVTFFRSMIPRSAVLTNQESILDHHALTCSYREEPIDTGYHHA